MDTNETQMIITEQNINDIFYNVILTFMFARQDNTGELCIPDKNLILELFQMLIIDKVTDVFCLEKDFLIESNASVHMIEFIEKVKYIKELHNTTIMYNDDSAKPNDNVMTCIHSLCKSSFVIDLIDTMTYRLQDFHHSF
jgi:hypothetical protein